ncbi:MAG: PilN domain-containing protein [Candidatus Aminicenantes bacterium]|nr:PilN domain-containing protein [Candidatus Aminicenantes bacterium]MDH5385206.1 PilN domain-containing protein [Candidatus Aminicenantes bacterium]MDH5743306.1 PilN domain-containing protein [Candidatus Aminicenantes bacterium]
MIRINLLKPEKKEIREEPSSLIPEIREKKKTPVTGLIIIVAIVAVAALYYFQDKEIKQETSLLNQAQEEKKSLQYVLSALQELEEQKTILERKINLINQLKARQEIAVRIMDELSKNIPGWVWLTETSYNEKEVNIKGRALSNNLIADYVYNLESSPHLSSVRIISINQKREQSNQYLEFTLTANYDLPLVSVSSEELTQGEQK